MIILAKLNQKLKTEKNIKRFDCFKTFLHFMFSYFLLLSKDFPCALFSLILFCYQYWQVDWKPVFQYSHNKTLERFANISPVFPCQCNIAIFL